MARPNPPKEMLSGVRDMLVPMGNYVPTWLDEVSLQIGLVLRKV